MFASSSRLRALLLLAAVCPVPAGCGADGGGTAATGTGSVVATSAPGTGAATGDGIPGEFVLVKGDAWLYRAPAEGANVVRGWSTGAGVGDVVPMRLIRRLGEGEAAWLEVETVGVGSDLLGEPVRAHCYEGLEGLAAHRVRFFVRTVDLRSVTMRRIGLRFRDGTLVVLSRGVAVGPVSPDTPPEGWADRVLSVDGFELSTRLPSARIGVSYFGQTPTRAVGLPAPVAIGEGEGPKIPLLGGGTTGPMMAVALNGKWMRVPEQAVINEALVRMGRTAGGEAKVYDVQPHPAGGELVSIGTLCGAWQVVMPAGSISVGGSSIARGVFAPDPDRPVARAGARLFWPDGPAAGTVVERTVLGEESVPGGSRRCFVHPLFRDPSRGAAEPASGLTLCYDPSDLETVAPPTAPESAPESAPVSPPVSPPAPAPATAAPVAP